MKILNKKMKMKFVFILTVSISVAVLNVRIPFIAKNMLNHAIDLDFESIKKNTIILVLTIAGILIAELLRKFSMTSYKKDLINTIREKITEGLLYKPFNIFHKRKNQEYISIYNNDINEIVNNYYIQFIDILFNLFSIIIYSASLFGLHPLIALVVLITNAIPLLIPIIFKNKLNNEKQEYLDSLRRYNISLGDIINGFLNIKTNNVEEKFKNNSKKLSNDSNKKMQKYENTNSKSQIIIGFFSYFNYISIIIVGVYLITKNLMTAGGLLAAVGVSEMLVGPVISISYQLNIFNSIKKVKTSLFEEFKIIVYEEPKIYMNEDIEEIEIKNLNFKYDENHALKDINLKFEKNKKYLIYGKNGSGKSTLFKLISKIYGNYSGDILVNKRPLKKIEDKSYYEKIGIIFQKPFMFNDTLKENIFLYSNYEQNRLNQMIELMNLQRIENDIYNDKDFKDSEGNLSGGEIQKINISRVLLKKSKFLIIDEITSAFDVKSAYELEKSLLDNKNLTLLNIQHKLNRELIDLYDEIIILEDGKVKNILKNSKEKELILNEL